MIIYSDKTIEDFLKDAEEIKKGFIIAALTDTYIVGEWPYPDVERLKENTRVLEIRVFDEDREYKLFRSDIAQAFTCRITEKADEQDETQFYDEWQYLDIDEPATKNARKSNKIGEHEVLATGGGKYNLPLEEMTDAMIKLRYYIGRYEETGQARVVDWRAVTFRSFKKGSKK